MINARNAFSLPLTIRPKLFWLLFSGFILTTIIGTLSHECGHWLAASACGYQARIHFASTSYDSKKSDSVSTFMNEIIAHRQKEMKSGEPYPGKGQFCLLLRKQRISGAVILLSGPLQTILAGTIGLLLLLFRKPKAPQTELNLREWLLVLLALFWAREPVNFVVYLGQRIITRHWSQRMDEIRLARVWGFPKCSIIIPVAIVGLLVMAIVTFRIVPVLQRATFVAAAIIGGLVGYIFWLSLAGPVLMP